MTNLLARMKFATNDQNKRNKAAEFCGFVRKYTRM